VALVAPLVLLAKEPAHPTAFWHKVGLLMGRLFEASQPRLQLTPSVSKVRARVISLVSRVLAMTDLGFTAQLLGMDTV
jgi:hypothetical protein